MFRLKPASIKDEKSDYRIHVGFYTKHIYIFPTACGVHAMEEAIKRGAKPKYATQPGAGDRATGEGYVISIDDIECMQEIKIPDNIFMPIEPSDSTSKKGEKAVNIVKTMLSRGLIRLETPKVKEIKDENIQIEGTDIILFLSLRIQVKCDMRAGRKIHHRMATGNVFLQTAECNPFGLI